MIDRGWYTVTIVDGKVTSLRLRFRDPRTWRGLLNVALDLLCWWPGKPIKPRPLP